MLTNNIKLSNTKRVYIFVFFSVTHILIDIYISTPEPNRISVSNCRCTTSHFTSSFPQEIQKEFWKEIPKWTRFLPSAVHVRACLFTLTVPWCCVWSVVIALLCISRRWFVGEDRSPWDGPSHVSWQAETVQAVFHFQKTKGNREDGVFDT